MALFPDRPHNFRAIVPRTDLGVEAHGQGLTLIQTDQISRATDTYMRHHDLIGHKNKVAILPVIRQCVTDGLGRESITGTDDLSIAFRVGYDKRKWAIAEIEANLPNTADGSSFVGELALPKPLIQATAAELSKKPFMPTFVSGERIIEKANIRKPILRRLVQFCRDQIEQVIPGSNQIQLNPQQEIGLLRNLIFSWATNGTLMPLLTVEDFLANKDAFLANTSQIDTKWIVLSRQIGLEGIPAHQYLGDLSTQVRDFVSNIPPKPVAQTDDLGIAGIIDAAFKNLSPHFLVLNPFSRFGTLSENPNDSGRSIWDPERTATVTVSGQKFRFPTNVTLELAAILSAEKNPERSKQLKIASQHAADLLLEIHQQAKNPSIPTLQAQIASRKQELEQTRLMLQEGRIPSKIAFTQKHVADTVAAQLNVIDNELNFFNRITNLRSTFINTSLYLLPRYLNPDTALTPMNEATIAGLSLRSNLMLGRMRYFMQERVKKRVRSLQDAQDDSTFVGYLTRKAKLVNPDSELNAALDTTIIDIYSLRNKLLQNELFAPSQMIPESQFNMAWLDILSIENRRFRQRVIDYIASRYPDRTDDVITRRKITGEILTISNSAHHPLRANFERLRNMENADPESVARTVQRYLSEYRESYDDTLDDAAKTWGKQEGTLTIANSIDEDEALITYPASTSNWRLNPVREILSGLVRLAPVGTPRYPVDLRRFMTSDFEIDSSDPFSPTESFKGRRATILDTFESWLSRNNVNINRSLLDTLIRAPQLKDLVGSANTYHRFYGIAPEVKSWLIQQRRKLLVQKEQPQRFYKSPPREIIRDLERKLDIDLQRAQTLTREAAYRLRTKAQKLQDLGLLLPVES